MKRFDRNEWLARCLKRFNRRAAVDKPSADRQYASDYHAVCGLESVIDWLKGKGISVDFLKTDSGRYLPTIFRIEISASQDPQTQLYTLLHECGHLLVETSKTRYRDFPNGYLRVEQDVKGRDLLYKVDVIAEEFEAWNRGLKLAERLNVVVDRPKFDHVKANALKSYFRWASRRGRVADE